jgi:hypothetical protein
MRVSVTASNSAGSATASSDATAVVSALVSAPGALSGLIEDKSSYDGKTVVQNWPNAYDPSASCGSGCIGSDGVQPQLMPDPFGSGLKVQTLSTSPSDAESDSSSQRNDLDDWSYQDSKFSCCGLRGEKWFSWEVLFPSANGTSGGVSYWRFHPVNGEYNWVYQFHRDPTIGGSGAGSEFQVGILTDNPSDGANPRLFMDIGGGDMGTSNNVYNSPATETRYIQNPANFQRNHWYRFVMDINFSTTNTGYYRVWLDGNLVIDQTASTPVNWTKRLYVPGSDWVTQSTEKKQATLLYRSSTGYVDQPYVMLSNYHRATTDMGSGYVPVTWNSSILFREWKMGTSTESVTP